MSSFNSKLIMNLEILINHTMIEKKKKDYLIAWISESEDCVVPVEQISFHSMQ